MKTRQLTKRIDKCPINFVVEDMPAWNPNLRSKVAIRTSDTRYFVDPSIATAVLGLGPSALMDELPTFGLLFEAMVVRDLRVYAAVPHGEVRHYRDKNGLECDAVGDCAYVREDGVLVCPIGSLKP